MDREKCCEHVKQVMDVLTKLDLGGDYASSGPTISCPACDYEYDCDSYWRRVTPESAEEEAYRGR